ncbi:hypothetical protein HCZ30_16340 [Marivivens donghaensis]|uniref:Uncharacterized protein n=1 Tax=Marivivens donghaensis TaxID=1699413 RepID=A0ABX0W1X2_9RHOB|nr:hypothetical protein [Marivivens donghaensis]NIY73995.1 hypothetical protein [Marivivens donghaensis]
MANAVNANAVMRERHCGDSGGVPRIRPWTRKTAYYFEYVVKMSATLAREIEIFEIVTPEFGRKLILKACRCCLKNRRTYENIAVFSPIHRIQRRTRILSGL